VIGFSQEIGNLFGLDRDMLKTALVIGIGSAQQRHAVPGDHEKYPAIRSSSQQQRPISRYRRHDQMDALAQPAPCVSRLCGRDPLAGGIDDLPGADLSNGVGETVLNRRPACLPILCQCSGQLAIIHAYRSGADRPRDQFQHQPRIIGLRIAVGEAAAQTGNIEAGKMFGK